MKRKLVVVALVLLVLFAGISYTSDPFQQAKRFVAVNGERIEAAVISGEALPQGLNCVNASLWPGDHPMAEFTLSGWGLGSGTRYFGCYYSPDDVPLPFQNSGAELTQERQSDWVWAADGDNWGATRKIKENWYYFEAEF